jgi:Protein of unknown function (DUF3037)
VKPSRGYYCVIQYCPDLGRLEAANIGVLLLYPDRGFLRARTSSDNSRIRHFFGDEGHDWTRINSFKVGIEDRLEIEKEELLSLEALETFIARRANAIQITAPRPMRVTDPEKDLDRLFHDLVGGSPRVNRGPSLKSFLRQKFEKAGVDAKIKTDIRVKVPIFERQIEIPYGFQNGRFNLIQLARFQAANPEQTKFTACRYAVQGESLYASPDPHLGQLQLIVVGKFGSKQSSSRSSVERILKEHHVRLYAATELDSLVDEIKRTAVDLPEGRAGKGQPSALYRWPTGRR